MEAITILGGIWMWIVRWMPFIRDGCVAGIVLLPLIGIVLLPSLSISMPPCSCSVYHVVISICFRDSFRQLWDVYCACAEHHF